MRGFKDPAQGTYSLFDSGGNRIWLQRETPTGKYFDDVEFTFVDGVSGTCDITAKSRS